MRYLIGDIGGTNIRLALYDGDVRLAQAHTTTESGVAAAIRGVVEGHGPVDAGCLAVAGPVVGDRAVLTNVGVELRAETLRAELGFNVQLINDFHAQALAVTALGPADRHALLAPNAAIHPGDCVAIVGPGTGLGEALLVPDGQGGVRVIAGEGGHKRFAPRGAVARGLLEVLTVRHGAHVSVERVLSGPGLVDICRFLAPDAPDAASDPAWITAQALSGRADCRAAVHLFIDALADEAANLALQCNAGAVYIGGGIAPRILPLLTPRFRAAFEDKGRSRAWLSTVPVYVITHPDPGLLGARIAIRLPINGG